MKKTLLSLSLALAISPAFAQITLFEDSFESYTDFAIANVGNWVLTDVDLKNTYGFQGVTFPNSGVPKSFQVFNSTATTPPLTPSASSNWSARTGVRAMVCFAASTPAPSLNNDWLISPQIQLGSTNNTLVFWAKSCDTQFGLEKFRVGVSTTGTAPANFTIISSPPTITNPATAEWVQYTFNLDAYAGQNVRIGINCVSDDQFGFAVDDFIVTAASLSTDDFFRNTFTMFPNPAKDVLNISANDAVAMNTITVTDINGRTVKQQNIAGVSSTQVNVADLNTGMYFISIETEQGKGTAKFMKN